MPYSKHAVTAYDWLMGLLDTVGSQPTGKPRRQCPAHHDGSPSLSLNRGDDGQALLHCHAGCDTRKVLTALSCPMNRLYEPATVSPDRFARTFCRDLTFPPLATRGSSRHPAGRGLRLEAQHAYGDRYWLLRYRHPTTGAKELLWESLNHRGERVPGLLGVPTDDLPAYAEREVRKGIHTGEPALLVESESSVDALMRAGFYATTWAGGAASVKVTALRKALADPEDPTGTYPRTVVVPDNDPPGLAALATLAAAGLASHVLYPGEGEDARDLLNRVGPRALHGLIEDLLRTPPGDTPKGVRFSSCPRSSCGTCWSCCAPS